MTIDQAVYPKIFVAYSTQFFTFGASLSSDLQLSAETQQTQKPELNWWQEYLVYIAFVVVTLIIALFGISCARSTIGVRSF